MVLPFSVDLTVVVLVASGFGLVPLVTLVPLAKAVTVSTGAGLGDGDLLLERRCLKILVLLNASTMKDEYTFHYLAVKTKFQF